MCGFLLVFFSNFVPKTHRFWDIRLLNIQWPWNPGYGSLKVIENYTIQSGTHDFLLTFHSNYRPISHRFRDKRRYPSKIANFSHPRVFNAPMNGFPLEFGIGARGHKSLNDGATYIYIKSRAVRWKQTHEVAEDERLCEVRVYCGVRDHVRPDRHFSDRYLDARRFHAHQLVGGHVANAPTQDLYTNNNGKQTG